MRSQTLARFKFLHTADIHLDSPLRGLSRYEGVPADEVRLATRAALSNLVDTAIEEDVAFVIIAGDLYDGDWLDFGTGLAFCAAMGKLGKAGIDVFLLYGNHDAESGITKKLPLPDNVHAFGTRKPVSFVHETTGVVLHGWSYRDRDTRDNLASSYPAPHPNRFNIGVLHTALTGRPPHALYAPCTVQELAAKGYDYWALGHVHDFEIVCEAPYIVYPGNLQGRNVREVGPKGAVLVTVQDDRIEGVPQHVALDAVRWFRAVLDVADLASEVELQQRLSVALERAHSEHADGKPLMVRVILQGECAMHGELARRRALLREDVRAIALAVSDTLWIEKVVVATRAPAIAHSINEEAGDELRALVESGAADPELASALQGEIGEFLAKIPPDLGGDQELLTQLRGGDPSGLLADAAASLISRVARDGR